MPGNIPHPDIYEPLSHTGDLGMLVYGRDLPELFAHAAWAMFDLMSDATTIRPQHTVTLSVSAADLEDLLVRWLGELLYLYDTQRLLCCTFTFTLPVTPPAPVFPSGGIGPGTPTPPRSGSQPAPS